MSKRNPGFISIFIIILIALAGLTYLGYSIYKNQKTTGDKKEVDNTKVSGEISRSATPTEAEVLTPTSVPVAIPANWKTYNKSFAGTHFYFRFPESYTAVDSDPDSGEIYLYKDTNAGNPDVVIDNLLHLFPTFEPYKTGSRRIWFRNNISKVDPSADFSNLLFVETAFGNSKSYLNVSEWPTENGFSNNRFVQGDVYFGIQNGKAVYFLNKTGLGSDIVNKILYSLEIK